MRYFIIIILAGIGLAFGWYYYYGGGSQSSRSEAVFREYGQQMHQRFEEIKRKTNFFVVEPNVIPAGFYFNGFEPQGSLADDQETIIFRYYKNEGKRYLTVYQRPVKSGETLAAPDKAGWDVVEETRLKNGASAYYLKKTKTEGGPVQGSVKGKQIEVEFATQTAELRLIAGNIFIRLVSSSGDVNLNGVKAEDRVLSMADLVKFANSFPGL